MPVGRGMNMQGKGNGKETGKGGWRIETQTNKRDDWGRWSVDGQMDEACVERAPAAATAACGLDGWAGTI